MTTSTVPSTTLPPPAATAAAADAPRPTGANGRGRALLQPVIDRVLAGDREYRRFAQSPLAADPAALQDFVLATDDEAADPAAVFERLRWGGQAVVAAPRQRRVAELAREFPRHGFVIEAPPASVPRGRPWRLLPFLAPRAHYFVARKTQLIRPGEFTDRFTYDVELVRHGPGGPYVVHKRVPTTENVVARLRRKFPDVAPEVLEKRARKFTDKIFPTFLTREAAMLKILQQHLPARFAKRVPHVIELEKDIRGFVTSFKMNWLRNGGRRLSQLEFAMGAAELLAAIHETAQVVHLDLRMDNMVVTDDGVGFVDFGSSVRVSEDLSTNPLLSTLFEELMRTSHIQRMLFQMTKSGQVTAEHLCSQCGRADKAIDVFYLALQFTTPHANPDLAALIHHDPAGEMARRIKRLSDSILRPHDPADPTHRSAKDILRSLEVIEAELGDADGA